MSNLLLLLTISAVAFPPLDSFLIFPAASTGCVDPRTTAAVAQQGRATGAVSASRRCGRSQRTLSRSRRTLSGRFWNPFPRVPTATIPLSSTAGSGEQGEPETADNMERTQQQQQRGGGEQRKKKKRPRSHVPVQEGEDEFVGEPWVGVASPQSAESALPEPDFKARQKFGRIMEDVLEAEKEEELPALLTKHIDFLLSVDVTRLTNDLIRLEPTMNRVKMLHNAYDFIVTFLEGMVESTLDVQKENQGLLREIIEAAKIGPSEFENKMKALENRFTYEFVKYLDAEVERLEDATKKSDRPGAGDEVLNVMKIVRIRVCAQVDLMMGEDVAVLTRMLSYNDRYMMRAALRSVYKDKTPQAVEEFGKLVSRTLKDVTDMGTGVDPMLRCKLADMEDDVVLVAKDIKERMEERASEGAGA